MDIVNHFGRHGKREEAYIFQPDEMIPENNTDMQQTKDFFIGTVCITCKKR